MVAHPLKDCLSRIAKKIIDNFDEDNQDKACIIRSSQIRALIDAHHVETTQHNCEKAFEACGLFPRDCDKILGNKNFKESNQSFIQTNIKTTSSITISGLCITSDEVLPKI